MEKKEKRKQQTQKEHKHELISPVNQEVTFNKLSKNIKGIKRALNKRRTGTPGFKRKRARLSSCSSEPLSPDDHSSNATTPTTPKVTSASSLPEQEPSTVTPSTSPSRSFRFPKDSKQVCNYWRNMSSVMIKDMQLFNPQSPVEIANKVVLLYPN